MNYCADVTCLNNGICRSTLLNFTCTCLGDSYSGRHCELTASKTQVRAVLSRSFAFVAITAAATVALFIVVMDVLKYGFGIDPTAANQKPMLVEKSTKPRVTVRFMYVNPCMDTASAKRTSGTTMV